MKKFWLRITMGLFCVAIGSACAGSVDRDTASQLIARPVPPAEFTNLRNPLTGQEQMISAGQGIYQANCSICHGAGGMGDGPSAGGLSPKPQPLAANQEELSDSYLYWRIGEGGVRPPFASAMPAWKFILSEEQIWQVISYLRTISK